MDTTYAEINPSIGSNVIEQNHQNQNLSIGELLSIQRENDHHFDDESIHARVDVEQEILRRGRDMLPELKALLWDNPDSGLNNKFLFSRFFSVLASSEDVPMLLETMCSQACINSSDLSTFSKFITTLDGIIYEERSQPSGQVDLEDISQTLIDQLHQGQFHRTRDVKYYLLGSIALTGTSSAKRLFIDYQNSYTQPAGFDTGVAILDDFHNAMIFQRDRSSEFESWEDILQARSRNTGDYGDYFGLSNPNDLPGLPALEQGLEAHEQYQNLDIEYILSKYHEHSSANDSALEIRCNIEQEILRRGREILPELKNVLLNSPDDYFDKQYLFSKFVNALATFDDAPLILEALDNPNIRYQPDRSAFDKLINTLNNLVRDKRRDSANLNLNNISLSLINLHENYSSATEDEARKELLRAIALTGSSAAQAYFNELGNRENQPLGFTRGLGILTNYDSVFIMPRFANMEFRSWEAIVNTRNRRSDSYHAQPPQRLSTLATLANFQNGEPQESSLSASQQTKESLATIHSLHEGDFNQIVDRVNEITDTLPGLTSSDVLPMIKLNLARRIIENPSISKSQLIQAFRKMGTLIKREELSQEKLLPTIGIEVECSLETFPQENKDVRRFLLQLGINTHTMNPSSTEVQVPPTRSAYAQSLVIRELKALGLIPTDNRFASLHISLGGFREENMLRDRYDDSIEDISDLLTYGFVTAGRIRKRKHPSSFYIQDDAVALKRNSAPSNRIEFRTPRINGPNTYRLLAELQLLGSLLSDSDPNSTHVLNELSTQTQILRDRYRLERNEPELNQHHLAATVEEAYKIKQSAPGSPNLIDDARNLMTQTALKVRAMRRNNGKPQQQRLAFTEVPLQIPYEQFAGMPERSTEATELTWHKLEEELNVEALQDMGIPEITLSVQDLFHHAETDKRRKVNGKKSTFRTQVCKPIFNPDGSHDRVIVKKTQGKSPVYTFATLADERIEPLTPLAVDTRSVYLQSISKPDTSPLTRTTYAFNIEGKLNSVMSMELSSAYETSSGIVLIKRGLITFRDQANTTVNFVSLQDPTGRLYICGPVYKNKEMTGLFFKFVDPANAQDTIFNIEDNPSQFLDETLIHHIPHPENTSARPLHPPGTMISPTFTSHNRQTIVISPVKTPLQLTLSYPTQQSTTNQLTNSSSQNSRKVSYALQASMLEDAPHLISRTAEVRYDPTIDSHLNEAVQQLMDLHGKSLKQVILFGSFARNQTRKGSDIDLLAIVDDQADVQKAPFEFTPTIHDEIAPACRKELSGQLVTSIDLHSIREGDLRNLINNPQGNQHEFINNIQADGISIYPVLEQESKT
jgi:predicted nucleotidyltransferase